MHVISILTIFFPKFYLCIKDWSDAAVNLSLLGTSGITHFLGGNLENKVGTKKGVSPTCEQSLVSLAPYFVPFLAITSLCLLKKTASS